MQSLPVKLGLNHVDLEIENLTVVSFPQGVMVPIIILSIYMRLTRRLRMPRPGSGEVAPTSPAAPNLTTAAANGTRRSRTTSGKIYFVLKANIPELEV
jgi:hypothetical protein